MPESYAFCLFACAVGEHFDRLSFFGRAGEAEELLPRGPELVPLPFYPSLRHLPALARALRGVDRVLEEALGRVDVLWVFGPHPVALRIVRLARARGKPVVLGVRQDTPRYFRTRLPSRAWTPALVPALALDRAWRRLSRRVPTTAVGDELAARFGGPAPTLAIVASVIRDADVVDAVPERDWSGAVELLAVGRIDEEKNPLLLVEALARLPERFRLRWAGSGPLESAVRARAAELGVSGRLQLLGFVPFGPELLDLYRGSHAFVHVALTEGVPSAVVEAAASGLPSVATDVGGVRRAIGVAALLVPPRDAGAIAAAVLRLAEEQPLRRGLAERGLELARGLTVEAQSKLAADFLAAAVP